MTPILETERIRLRIETCPKGRKIRERDSEEPVPNTKKTIDVVLRIAPIVVSTFTVIVAPPSDGDFWERGGRAGWYALYSVLIPRYI